MALPAIKPELVLVPRFSANDDFAILVAWSKKDGDTVAAGEKICELEFSKTVMDVTAPSSGFLFRMHEEGDEVPVGKPLAAIAATPERPAIHVEAPAAAAVKVTAKARKLIETHNIDLAQFQGLGIVKEEHVLKFLETQPSAGEPAEAGEFKPLTPVQRRVAKTLTESVRTIPHSYLCRWVDAAAIEARVAKISETHEGLMVSVSDWLVATVAREAKEHPKVLASWRENGVFYHPHAHVGFALNQPNGDLLVPVIREAEGMELDALIGRIRGLQKKAIRHKLEPPDLTGGTITVTSLIGTGVHQVFPILVPEQAAIIAIGDRCALGPVQAYALTIGFDHRILNGAEAAAFLSAVADALAGGPRDDE